METNLNNTYFYIILSCLIIIIGCFYFIYKKIKKMNDMISQLQKHLMYQQNLIEKHSSILIRNSSPTNINPNDLVQNIQSIPSFVEETEKKEEETQPSPPVEEKPNPIQTLLPMINSLMGMMNQGDEDENVDGDEIEEEEEEELKKTEMVKEIEKELDELKNIEKDNSVKPEGRVEE